MLATRILPSFHILECYLTNANGTPQSLYIMLTLGHQPYEEQVDSNAIYESY